jgi:porin
MKKRIATSDLTGRPHPYPSTRRAQRLGRFVASKLSRTAAVGSLLALSFTALPVAAFANCEVPEEPFKSPPGVVFPIDVVGSRVALAKAGIGAGANYYGETFYNWGGIKDGGQYDGVLELYMNADMQKLGFWKGFCFHTNGYQIHGNSITAENVGGIMPISNLEADASTRLFELWFEQHLFNDTVSVRIGQLAADAEFIISEGGGYFLNGAWGWPPIAAENNPGGGPAYPLATPGVRVAVTPTERTSLMVGVYNGDPAPQCNKDGDNSQRCNDHGLDFELDDSPLLMAEGAYSFDLAEGRLPGTIKIGGWNHFGDFEHLRVASGRGLIGITGNAGKLLDLNWALYGIIDQLIWRVPGRAGGEGPQGVAIFARIMGAPSDRNLVDFYFDGGFTFTGMIPNRPNDALAIGFAYTGISNEASAFDIDAEEDEVRDHESLVEICYTFQVNDGWSVQPDFQYLWKPGGGVAGVDDAAVIGARTTLSF